MTQAIQVYNEQAIQTGTRGLVFRNINDIREFCICLQKSGFAPRGNNSVEGMIVSIAMGMEIGLSPMQSIQNIAPINGKPSVYGDAIPALILSSGLCNGFSEWFEGAEGSEDFTAVCQMHRIGFSQPFIERFGVRDAKRARLWGKDGPWTTNPKRMLQMRARAFCGRNAFADVLKGLVSKEEAVDYQDLSSSQTIESTGPLPYEPPAMLADPAEQVDAVTGEITRPEPAPAAVGSESPPDSPAPIEDKKELLAQCERLADEIGLKDFVKSEMKSKGYKSLKACPIEDLLMMREELEMRLTAIAESKAEHEDDVPFDMQSEAEPQQAELIAPNDDAAPEW